MITNWNFGDRVVISEESFKNIFNANRSIHAFPDDSYLKIAYELMRNNIHGTVTMKFKP